MAGSSESFYAFNNVFDWLGFLGGCMFPLATGAQVLKVIVTKSATDISVGWEGMYYVAETFSLTYTLHFRLWPLVIPIVIELVLLTALVPLKVYCDYFGPKRERWRAAARYTVLTEPQRTVTEMQLCKRRETGSGESKARVWNDRGDDSMVEIEV